MSGGALATFEYLSALRIYFDAAPAPFPPTHMNQPHDQPPPPPPHKAPPNPPPPRPHPLEHGKDDDDDDAPKHVRHILSSPDPPHPPVQPPMKDGNKQVPNHPPLPRGKELNAKRNNTPKPPYPWNPVSVKANNSRITHYSRKLEMQSAVQHISLRRCICTQV